MTGALLRDIAAAVDGELIGAGGLRIERIATLHDADASSITFLSNPVYAPQLATTRAGCVIVGPSFRDQAAARGAAIVAPDPYLAFATLTQWWAARDGRRAESGVHPSAVVDPGAVLGDGVSIGAQSVVSAGCRIGAGSRIGPRVTLLQDVRLGERCIVHPGAVIGADGFGFAPSGGRWVKIEQLGGVVIGDDVEIGANTCIDRGAIGDTEVADGVKIDNLVQIGHNVKIGAHTAIAGCVGIAGSTTIGAHCMIGGGVGITGHVSIADGVVLSGATQVTRSIAKAGRYGGPFPFDDNAAWEKNAATLRNLYALRERVRALEKKIAP